MRREGFGRRVRLRRRRDFLRVQGGGQKHHVEHFLVFVAPSPRSEEFPRLGITVTRKVGNAVKRNRIKRLVRDAFRRRRAGFRSGIDLVWIAKRQATTVTHDEVERDFERLLARPGMRREERA